MSNYLILLILFTMSFLNCKGNSIKKVEVNYICENNYCGDSPSTNAFCFDEGLKINNYTCVNHEWLLNKDEICESNNQCIDVCIMQSCKEKSLFGGFCDEDMDCSDITNTCFNNVCVQTCMLDMDCGQDEICLNQFCIAPSQRGEGCSQTEECISDLICESNICKSFIGSECEFSEQCVSGFCVDQVCCESACDQVCMECNSMGQCIMPEDDITCGEINCSQLNLECIEYDNLVSNRCKELGECKDVSVDSCEEPIYLDDNSCDDGTSCTLSDKCLEGICVGDISCTLTDASTQIEFMFGNRYGASWGDFDQDGFIDLILSGNIYHNNSNDTPAEFLLVSQNEALGNHFSSFSDVDNDGYLDIFSLGLDHRSFYLYDEFIQSFRLRGVGELTDIYLNSYNPEIFLWFDFNRDGFSDIFFPHPDFPYYKIYTHNTLSNTLFNVVDGLFTKLESAEGMGFSFAVADIDNDKDLDIWYNDNGDGSLLLNQISQGIQGFSEVSNEYGLSHVLGRGKHAYAVAFGDYNNDGFVDLFLGSPDFSENKLYRNEGNGKFILATESLVNVDLGITRNASWGDFDHDGDLDLLVANENQNNSLVLYKNNQGVFSDIADDLGISNATNSVISADFVDIDSDGDLDIYIVSDEKPSVLWLNDLNNQFYLKVYVQGSGGENLGASKDAIGTRISLYKDNVLFATRQIGYNNSSSTAMVHFGLSENMEGIEYMVVVDFIVGNSVTLFPVIPNQVSLNINGVQFANTIQVFQ